MGRCSFELRVLPEFPGVYFLREDDEFPAQLIITFDRTIDRHLPLDVSGPWSTSPPEGFKGGTTEHKALKR